MATGRCSLSSTSGTLSIDRITLLFYTPQLAMWNKGDNSLLVRMMANNLENVLKNDLDPDFPQGSQTDLFAYHYRTISGFDIQFGTKMPKRKKITDEHYIMSFGTVSDKNNGFMWQTMANEYAFRVEWNPNKSESFYKLVPFFSQFTNNNHLSDIRVARLDLAVDYPVDINPCLVLCDRVRKSFTATGSDGLETVYFGTRSSENYFRLYNKAKEILEKDGVDLGHPLWRLELECKKGFYLSETPDFSSSFSRFHFFEPVKKTGDWVLDLIYQQASIHGLQAVLRMMPKNTQTRYRKFFNECKICSDIETPSFICARDFNSVFNALRCEILLALGYDLVEGGKYGKSIN